MKTGPFDAREIAFLEFERGAMTAAELAESLGRSERAVELQLRSLDHDKAEASRRDCQVEEQLPPLEAAVRRLVRHDPNVSADQLAARFGCTRERAQQLRTRFGGRRRAEVRVAPREILAVLADAPERWWTVRELADRLNTPTQSLAHKLLHVDAALVEERIAHSQASSQRGIKGYRITAAGLAEARPGQGAYEAGREDVQVEDTRASA